MKILKLASREEQILDHKNFLFFNKALNLNAIFWSSVGQKKFNKVSESNGWITYKSQRQGTINQATGFRTPEFFLNVYIFYKNNEKMRYRIELLNKKNTKIAFWHNGEENEDVVLNGELENFLSSQFKIKDFEHPPQIAEEQFIQKFNLIKSNIDNRFVYQYLRLTKSKDNYSFAQSLEIWMEPVSYSQPLSFNSKFYVYFRNNDIENGIVGKIFNAVQSNEGLLIQAAFDYIKDLISKASFNGFVDEKSSLYIPIDANQNNWDFNLNIRKTFIKPANSSDNLRILDDEDFNKKTEKTSSFSDYMKKMSQSYDFGGYYSGNIPDPSGYIGTSAVEAGQIKSVFSGADRAIQYVNEFNSDLLKNIAFIFNFSKAGAYGVYLSELDRAIKTEVLKKKLKQKGYKISDENGVLAAYPQRGEIPKEQIDKDINSLYEEINQGGGTAIGINMSNVLNAAKSDVNNIPTTESQFLYEQLAILHLGETIVHEAIHAKGHHDEGPSEQGESAFANWVLPKINQVYLQHLKSVGKENEFNEIVVGGSRRHASKFNWYKMAQYSNPHNLFSPNGSDLSGRMGGWNGNLHGRQEWSMIFNQMSHISLEQRLGRQFMWPLSQDINLEKDSIEQQLRKTFKTKTNVEKSTEELLQKDRAEESELYKALEEKLNDNRPAPLLQILKKDASIKKIATLFGWYNNLEISDGSTIPGLSDRVMAWDDRDEDFTWSESDIRKQPRYNPEYDTKGFYYRWIEPRFAPQDFNQMVENLSNTHPAKRFANNQKDDNSSLEEISQIICRAKDYIYNGKIKACRFIVSNDLLPYLMKLLENCKVVLFNMENVSEPSSSLWIKHEKIEDEQIEKAEKYFKGENSFEMVANELLGLKSTELILDQVIKLLKKIQLDQGLEDIYLAGEPAREKIYNEKISSTMFRFCCHDKTDAATYGQLISNEIGHKFDYNKNGDLIIFVNDIILVFHSGENTNVCKKLIELGANEEDMNDGVKCELSNKDFTINMIAINIIDNTIYDPFDVKDDIENKILKSKYDISDIIKLNPMIVLKILKMQKMGFKVDELYLPFIENGISSIMNMDDDMIEMARIFAINSGIIGTGE